MKRIAFLLLAGALSGCGGGARSSHPTTSTLGVLQDLARCVRAHGVPGFPDPVVRNDGVPVFPDSAPRVPPSAQQACRTIIARIPPNYTTTVPVSHADFDKLLALARCVRVHGIPDWPDPNTLGEFPIGAAIQRGGKRLFVHALHACARLNPNPDGGVNVVRAP